MNQSSHLIQVRGEDETPAGAKSQGEVNQRTKWSQWPCPIQKTMERSTMLSMGKSTINIYKSPFSIAMLVITRGYVLQNVCHIIKLNFHISLEAKLYWYHIIYIYIYIYIWFISHVPWEDARGDCHPSRKWTWLNSHDGSMVLLYMVTWLGYIDGIHGAPKKWQHHGHGSHQYTLFMLAYTLKLGLLKMDP